MTSKLFAFAALIFMLAGCSAEQQQGTDSECQEDGDCPSGFTCNEGLCEGSSAVTGDGGPDNPGNVGDGGVTVEAAGEAADGVPAVVTVETDGCKGPTCEIKAGSDVTFIAEEVPGYRFVGWSGSPRCEGSNRILMLTNVEANIRCYANYVKRVKVTGGSSSAQADVTAASDSAFANCSGATCEVDEGATVVITADELDGYRFAGFGGGACSNVEGFSVYVTAGKDDISCTATYVRSFEVTGSLLGASGNVEVTSDTAFASCMNGTCLVDEEGSVILAAPDLDGFRFAGWSGDAPCVGTSLTLEITPVSDNVSCTANYVARFTALGIAAGTPTNPAPLASSESEFALCMEGRCEVDEGSTVVIRAQTVPGYRFTGFTGPGCDDVSGTAVTLTDLSANLVCTARYVQGIAISGNVVNGPDLPVAISATPAPVSCTPGSCVVDASSTVSLTAPAGGAGFRFLGWTGDTGCTGSSLTLNLGSITTTTTCQANYAPRAELSFPDPSGGSVAASDIPTDAVCDSDSCTVDAGDTITLTATADAGSRFVGWSGCSTSSAAAIQVTVDASATCTANFATRFVVSGTSAPSGLTVTASSSGSAAQASCTGNQCTVDGGTTPVTLTAAASSNDYEFNGWTGAGCTETDPDSNPLTLRLASVSQNLSCSANYRVRLSVAVAGAPGRVSINNPGTGITCTPSAGPFVNCWVNVSTSATIVATDETGARFTAWSGDAGCTGSASHALTVSAPTTCTATFIERWNIAAVVGPVAGGTVAATPNGQAACAGASCAVDQDVPVTLSATPSSAAFRFRDWSGTSPACTGTSASLTLQNVNATCTANFVARWNIGAVVDASGGGSVAATPNGQPACAGAACTVDQNVQVTLAATASSAAFRFRDWSGANPACTGTNPALTLQNTNATCTANFIARWTIAATVSTGGGGSVSATPNGQAACSGASCTVDQNVAVTLVATPSSAAYRFRDWTGTNAACAGNNASLTLQNTNATCTANFVGRWTIAAAVGPVAGGSVSATPSGQSACAGASCTVDQNVQVTLAATANTPAYRFVNWQGANAACAGSNPSLTLQNTNATCSAIFAERIAVSGTSAPAGLTVTASSSASSPQAVCSGNQCTVDGENTPVTLTAAASNADYEFNGWSGANCTESDPDGNPLTLRFASVSDAVSCTANYRVRISVALAGTGAVSINNPGAGITCTPSAGPFVSCFVPVASAATIVATDTSGSRFTAWGGGAGCAGAATHSVTVNAPTTCTASFGSRFVVSGASTATGLTVAASSTASSPQAVCTGNQCTVDGGNTPVTLTAAASNADYEFSGWTGTNCTETNADSNPLTLRFASVNESLSCTATYRVRVSVTSAGAAGAVSITNPGAGITCTPSAGPFVNCFVPAASSASIVATDNAGARFTAWSGGAGCPGAANHSLSVSAPTTCTATFASRFVVSGTSAPAGLGVTASSSVASPQAVCSGNQCTVDGGNTPVTLTAAASTADYEFNGWSGANCTETDADTNPLTLRFASVSQALACTATYRVRVSVALAGAAGSVSINNPGAGITCTPAGGPFVNCFVPVASSATIVATAGANTRFTAWSGDAGCAGAASHALTVSAPTTCTASFAGRFLVSGVSAPGGLTVTASSSVSAPQATCSGNQCTVDGGNTPVTLTAAASTSDYEFSGWSGANCVETDADSNPLTLRFANVTQNLSCTASYRVRVSVALTGAAGSVAINNPGAGITCTPAGGPFVNCFVPVASSATIVATGNANARFTAWSGDAGCAGAASHALTVSAPTSCSANFASRFVVSGSSTPAGLTVTASSSAGAPQATCSGNQCTVDGSNTPVVLTASASTADYEFNGWTGTNCTETDADTNPLTLRFASVSQNLSCTANYRVRISVALTGAAGSVSINNPGAGITCTPAGGPFVNCFVPVSTAATIVATNNGTASFTEWSGPAGCPGAASHALTVSAPTTCTANFTSRFVVSGTSAPAGLTVTASSSAGSPQATCSGNQCTVDGGTTPVTLTAAASTADYEFSGWSGTNCTETAADTNPLTLRFASVSQSLSCTANYRVRISVALTGAAGAVSITNPGAGITCTPAAGPFVNCFVPLASSATIVATGNANARFTAWNGDAGCAGAASHGVTVNAPTTCSANFASRFVVTGTSAPSGLTVTATSTSGAPQANCSGNQCTVDGNNTPVTLTAAASTADYEFNGWSGTNCTETDADANPLTLRFANVSQNLSCTANYRVRISVALTGGAGTVSINNPGAGITCTPAGGPFVNCFVPVASSATIVATDNAGARFNAWGGDAGCAGAASHALTVNAPTTCTATFASRFVVSGVSAPAGRAVTATSASGPPQAVCSGNQCTVDGGNTPVTLTAAASNADYEFNGWSGANCTETDPDTNPLTLRFASVSQSLSCTANYRVRISVALTGAAGSVSINNPGAGITCTPAAGPFVNCFVPVASSATIVATGNAGARFLAWSGDAGCAGAASHALTVSAPTSCSANFASRFVVSGVSAPAGLTVAATSSVSAPQATCSGNQCTVDGSTTPVTLTAAASNADYEFSGWSGTGCTETDADSNPLTLRFASVSQNLSCTANYRVRLTVALTGAAGSVSISNPGAGITCTPAAGPFLNCFVPLSSSQTIVATSTTSASFSAWSGPAGCAGAASHALTVSAPTTCTASFAQMYRARGLIAGASTTSIVTITPCGTNDCIVQSPTDVTFTAPNISGYAFTNWTGTGCSDANPDNNPRTLQFSPLPSDLTCTANYALQRFTIAVTSAQSSIGQVQVNQPTSGNPSCVPAAGPFTSCTVDSGTPVTIAATFPANTRFIRWSGGTGCASTSRNQSLTVSSNVTCTAEFYGLWSRTYGVPGTRSDRGFGTLLDPEGQVLVSGIMSPDTSRAWLSQLDEHSGAVRSHTGFTNGSNVLGYGLATNNDGYVIATAGIVGQFQRPMLVGVDRGRNLSWAREIPTSDASNDYLQRVVFYPRVISANRETVPGYVAVGYAEGSPRLGHLSAVSPTTGAVLFNRTFCAPVPASCLRGTPTCLSTLPTDIVAISSGFITVSQVQSANGGASYAALTVFDPSGATLEEHYFTRRNANGAFDDLLPEALINTPDGGYLMVGRTRTFAAAAAVPFDGFAIKLTPAFNIEWQVRVGDDKSDEQFRRATNSLDDGEFVLTGYASGPSQNNDGWLVRLQKDGTIVPDNTATRPVDPGDVLYDLGATEELHDIVAMLDGGYSMTGLRRVNADSGSDAWSLRVDGEGAISFNAASGARLSYGSHPLATIPAEGPTKSNCTINSDRMTAGTDQVDAFKKNTTPFTVTETAQAP